jgi:hypothetical protein
MSELIKVAIFVVLGAIVLSLGSAFYHLATGKGDSTKMVRSLTVRISLSIVLFLLMMAAWRMGIIQPHGVGH